MIDIQGIMEILPHRYPLLLVDRVLEVGNGKVKAYKNVTANEEFFNGHFPGHPVMPGVLVIEAMAQAVAILTATNPEFDRTRHLIYLAGIDGARFRRPVRPGDRLDLEGVVVKHKSILWKMACRATVDGETVAEAELMATIAER